MKIVDNRLDIARFIDSPNSDLRPDADDISLIVIHCISLPPGQFGSAAIHQLFQNRLDPDEHPYFSTIHTLRVSAHILIDREGIVFQYVPFDRRAWHAGQSSYQGRSACNDFSIGIELEGTDDSRFTPIQYTRLAQLIKALLEKYPTLSEKRIAGHDAIAPGRKTDPGEFFDWELLNSLLAGG